ncbi:MAG TPA: hypothetical protein VEA59_03835 [Patescibacteria group bacterium]|nr:hypothetical protein [Patescibacteria group bacterium]
MIQSLVIAFIWGATLWGFPAFFSPIYAEVTALILSSVFMYAASIRLSFSKRMKLIVSLCLLGIASVGFPGTFRTIWIGAASLVLGFLHYSEQNQTADVRLEYAWIRLMLFSFSFFLFETALISNSPLSFSLALIGLPLLFYYSFTHLERSDKRKPAAIAVLSITGAELMFGIWTLPALPLISALLFTALTASLFQIVHYYMLHELSVSRLKYELFINGLFIVLGTLAGDWSL